MTLHPDKKHPPLQNGCTLSHRRTITLLVSIATLLSLTVLGMGYLGVYDNSVRASGMIFLVVLSLSLVLGTTILTIRHLKQCASNPLAIQKNSQDNETLVTTTNHTMDTPVNNTLDTEDHRLEHEMTHEKNTWKSAKILVVDDLKANQKVTLGMLSVLGCDPNQCQVANNGQQAVDSFKTNSFDLVLMDCQMPIMDGFLATSSIRTWEKENKKHSIPIIAFTADITQDSQKAGDAAGMNGYLTKPVTLDGIQTLLERYLPIKKEQTPCTNSAPISATISQLTSEGTTKPTSSIIAELRATGFQESDLKEIAELIITQLTQMLTNFQKSLEDRDIESSLAISHVLKGNMANSIFSSLKEPSQMLYDTVKHQDWESIEEQFWQVREIFKPIKEALHTFTR